MDPALAALDFAKAGAILADMVVSYLAAGALPSDPEGPDDHDLHASTSANRLWRKSARTRRARTANTTC